MKIYDKKHGIDISKWQGRVDWGQLSKQHKAGQLDFVIIRAGLGGGTVDPRFEEYYAAARAAGIPVGAYWYAYWGPYTPSQEATSFLRAVEGKILQYGLWYDVEYEPDILGMGKAERTSKVLEGLGALAASGRYVGLYASTDMVNNRLEYGRLRGYDIWCAQYASRNTCKLSYGIWQYTSSGSVEGIAGRVDCDRAYKDYPAIVTGPLAGGADNPAPLPTPAPAPGQEGREPREVHTYRVTGEGKGAADKLLALCDELGLYMLGSVTVAHGCSPVELLDLASRLALTGASSTTIGPATRGDLIVVLLQADALGLSVSWQIDVGPVSTGDTVTLQELAAKMHWNMKEVS